MPLGTQKSHNYILSPEELQYLNKASRQLRKSRRELLINWSEQFLQYSTDNPKEIKKSLPPLRNGSQLSVSLPDDLVTRIRGAGYGIETCFRAVIQRKIRQEKEELLAASPYKTVRYTWTIPIVCTVTTEIPRNAEPKQFFQTHRLFDSPDRTFFARSEQIENLQAHETNPFNIENEEKTDK